MLYFLNNLLHVILLCDEISHKIVNSLEKYLTTYYIDKMGLILIIISYEKHFQEQLD